MLIYEQQWFKAELQFICPLCSKVTTETILARGRDKAAVAIAIVERMVPIECSLCKTTCFSPAQIHLDDLTPEEVANMKVVSGSSTQVVM